MKTYNIGPHKHTSIFFITDTYIRTIILGMILDIIKYLIKKSHRLFKYFDLSKEHFNIEDR